MGQRLREITRMIRALDGISFDFQHGSVVPYVPSEPAAAVCSNSISIVLSPDLTFVYVLAPSSVVGRLASGRVSRQSTGELVVYDAYGRAIEYLSQPGGKVRSWCLLGPTGKPVDGWSQVLERDRTKVFPFKDSV